MRSAIWLSLLLIGGLAAFADDAAQDGVVPEPPIDASDRDHWAFRPLTRPLLPAVTNANWCRNEIDRFILVELEARGLTPMPEADRATLLRRVTFDLTGLPPTPEELQAFLADTSDQAYASVVDRLLASRAYGERWAQHWLDLARFAETDGFEHDKVRPNAWRYRDWVIQALNDDMLYDEFIRLQLAADELRPDDLPSHVATGFLLCGPDMPDINLQEERRHNFLNSLTGTVGAALMGLQMECASCHHHKYDPISQHDFYRLRAFFEPAELFRELPIPSDADEAVAARFERENAEKWESLAAELVKLKESGADQEDIAKLAAELDKVKSAQPPEMPLGRVVHESGKETPVSRLWVRGDFRRPGPELSAQFVRVLNPEDRDAVPDSSANSSGLRTALANWLTRPDHILATRVAVNRIWQHHFGRGIVGTPSDFGFMGDVPSHPELLDWLATELPRRGWSMKAMHRLMVTSAAYRMSSRRSDAPETWDALVEADPDNRRLGRANRQRLEGEAIRDAMLAASGRLSENAGGPGVRPPLPEEVVETLLKNQWPVTPNEVDHRRRSIYLFVRRNLRYPLFEVFDRPDTNQSCPRRDETTIAPQALQLLNSEFSLETAQALAELLVRECGDDPAAQVDLAYRRAFGRPPTDQEQRAAEEFLDASSNDETALVDYCLALLNFNEFVYID